MTLSSKIESLSEDQKKTFDALVRLGDSIELAYKTTIESSARKNNSEAYYSAYCL